MAKQNNLIIFPKKFFNSEDKIDSFLDFFEKSFKVNEVSADEVRVSYFVFEVNEGENNFKLFKLEETKHIVDGYISMASEWGKIDEEAFYYNWIDDDYGFDMMLLNNSYREFSSIEEACEYVNASEKYEDKKAIKDLMDYLIENV